MLGKAVAGNWVSMPATFADLFFQSWPLIPLLLFAIFVDRVFKPTIKKPTRSTFRAGLIPAVVYVGFAITAMFIVA